MTEEVSRQMNRGWTTRDIMVTAIISIALGLIYIPLTYLTGWAMAFPLTMALIMGIYYWPIIMMVYLIRKPGVALFSTAVSMLVAVPFTPWGISLLMHIITIGLPLEIIFLAGRYKNFKLWYLLLAGAIASLFSATLSFIMYGLANIDLLLQIVYFGGAAISGAFLGGLLAKLIGDAVIKTGVISNAPVESEKQVE